MAGSGTAIDHIDTHFFKRIREQIKIKQKLEVKGFPCDLEFAIQNKGQDQSVLKFIAPEIIPQQTDYFFTQNIKPYDGRPKLKERLRAELQKQYSQHQPCFNWLDTIPAKNHEWFLPEFAQTQPIKPEFEQNPFYAQFAPNWQ